MKALIVILMILPMLAASDVTAGKRPSIAKLMAACIATVDPVYNSGALMHDYINRGVGHILVDATVWVNIPRKTRRRVVNCIAITEGFNNLILTNKIYDHWVMGEYKLGEYRDYVK